MNDRNITPANDARAALQLIRETIERLAPGILVAPEHALATGPALVDEAKVLFDAIVAVASMPPSLVGRPPSPAELPLDCCGKKATRTRLPNP